MEKLDKVIQYLKQIDRNFYGQVIIKIREGKAVLITEERTIKLEGDEQKIYAENLK